MNDRKDQKITVGAIITVVWFVASIYAIVQFAMNKEIFLMFLVVGQYIIGFGIMTLSASNKTNKNNDQSMMNKNDEQSIILQNKVPLVKQEDDSYVAMSGVIVDSEMFRKSTTRLGHYLLMGGIALIICVYLAFHPEVLGVEVSWELLFFLCLISVMVIVSFRICYKAIKKHRDLKNRCYVEVVAVISEYVKRHKNIKYPVYKFMFNGKEYFICHNTGSRRISTPIGNEIKLMINPNMPYEYITSNLADGLLELFVGVPVFVLSVISLILFIMKFGKGIF